MDVGGDDGDFDDGEDVDEGNDGEKAEDVVVPAFVLPDRTEDEEEFDENYGEGDEAREEDGVDGPGVPGLWGDGPWLIGGFGGVLVGLAVVDAEVGPDVDEGELYEEPKGDEAEEGGEGEGGGGALGPDEEVEKEDGREESAGEEERGRERVLTMQGAGECGVDAGGEIAGEEACEDEEAHAYADEAATEAGVEDPKGAEEK